MAFRTSEIRLILTARNEASRTMRRVARDVGNLDNVTQLRNQARRLDIRRNELGAQRSLAAAELESLTTGTRALRLQQQLASAQEAEVRAQDKLSRLHQDDRRNYENMLRNQNAFSRNQRAIERIGSQTHPGRVTELFRERDRLLSQAVTLRNEEELIQKRLAAGEVALANRQTSTRSLAKANAELATRAANVRERINNLDAALAHNSILMQQNAAAQNAMRWNSIEMGSRMVAHLGRVLATVGVISVASLGLAAKSAADFNTQVTRAATQARAIGAPAAATARIAMQVNDEVLRQMQQFPATSQEMADSFYEVFSGTNVQSVRQASKMVEMFNMAAVAGATDLTTMTDAGLTLFNNFTEGSNRTAQLTEQINLFFAAVRYARTDATAFAASLSNVIPFAKQAGLTFEDVAFALATLTRATGKRMTSRDATGLFRQIELLARPEVIAGLHSMGVEVQAATGEMRPLKDILNDINENLVKTGKFRPGPELLNFFKTVSAEGGAGTGSAGLAGTAQARRNFAFLIQSMDEYNTVAADIHKNRDQFIKDFKAMSQTPGVKWDVMVNQLKAFVIVVGTDVIPVLVELSYPLVQAFRWFAALPDPIRKTIAQIVAIAAVTALVVGPLLALAGGAAAFYLELKGIQRISGGAAGSLGKIAGIFAGGKGLQVAARDAGAVNVRLAILFGTISAGIFILTQFGDQLDNLATDADGAAAALKILSAVLTAMLLKTGIGLAGKLVAWTSGLTALGGSAGVAAPKLAAVARWLARLAKTRLITVTVAVVIARKLDLWGLGKDLSKKVGGALTGDSSPGWMIPGHSERDIAIKKFAEKDRKDIERLRKNFVLRWDPKLKTFVEVELVLPDNATIQKEAVRARKAAAKALEMTDPQFMRRVRAVDRLREAYEAAPSPATWRAFHNALDKLTKASTAEQKKMLNDFIGNLQTMGSMSDAAVLAAMQHIESLRKQAKEAKDPAVAFALAKQAAKEMESLQKNATDLQLSAADAATSLSEKEVKLSNAAFAVRWNNLQKLKKAADKSNDPAVLRAYYEAEAKLSEDATSAQMQAVQELDSRREAAHQKELERQKQNVTNAKSAIKEITDNITRVYENALQRNRSQLGQLFAGPFTQSAEMQNRLRFGFKLRPQDIVKDLQQSTQQFVNFRSTLDELAARGAPEALIEQLRDMGPEVQAQLDTMLNKASPQQLQKWFKAFDRGQKETAEAARQDMKREIEKWMRFGKDVARGIARGIRSENAALETELRNMVLRMFPGLSSQAGAKEEKAPQPTKGGDFVVNFNGGGAGSDVVSQLRQAHFGFRNKAPLA